MGKLSPAHLLAFQDVQRYTPEGWIGGDTNRQNVDRKSIPPPQETLMRTPVDQSVELTFDSNKLFHGGNISRISRDAVAETLRPMSFEIDLKGSFSGSELPEDVRELAEEIAGYNPKFAKYGRVPHRNDAAGRPRSGEPAS